MDKKTKELLDKIEKSVGNLSKEVRSLKEENNDNDNPCILSDTNECKYAGQRLQHGCIMRNYCRLKEQWTQYMNTCPAKKKNINKEE